LGGCGGNIISNSDNNGEVVEVEAIAAVVMGVPGGSFWSRGSLVVPGELFLGVSGVSGDHLGVSVESRNSRGVIWGSSRGPQVGHFWGLWGSGGAGFPRRLGDSKHMVFISRSGEVTRGDSTKRACVKEAMFYQPGRGKDQVPNRCNRPPP